MAFVLQIVTGNKKTLFIADDGRNLAFTFILISSLLLLWGLSNVMIDVMDKHFQEELRLSKSQSALVRLGAVRALSRLTRISHRTGFLREGGEVQVTESRRDRRLSVAGGRKTACNATKRRIPTSVGILCLLRQAS